SRSTVHASCSLFYCCSCSLWISYSMCFIFFFFSATAPTEIYTLSLHDALPIFAGEFDVLTVPAFDHAADGEVIRVQELAPGASRSEEHTSELQSLAYLVCRLLLEKKKNANSNTSTRRHAHSPCPPISHLSQLAC